MIVERTCPRCGTTFYEASPRTPGRPRRWCSRECRRSASEERCAAAGGAGAVTCVAPEISLDQHVVAVLESPAACRRVLRQVQEWEANGALNGAKWSGVAAEFVRLRRSAAPALTWLRSR